MATFLDSHGSAKLHQPPPRPTPVPTPLPPPWPSFRPSGCSNDYAKTTPFTTKPASLQPIANQIPSGFAPSQSTILRGTASSFTTTTSNPLSHPNLDHTDLNPSALPFSPTPAFPRKPVDATPVSRVELPSTSSWSFVTSSRDSIPAPRKLSFIVPARIESKWVATCKSDEIAKASTRLEEFLQGILIGKKPYILVLKKFLVSKWKLEGSLDLVPLEDGSLLFKFGRSEEKQKVLDAGPHFVAGHALALRLWRRGMAQGSSVLNAIPVWIQLPNLPLEFWSLDSLTRIGSTLGTQLFIDEHTTSLTRLGFPRICIEISPISKLPEDVLIRVEGGKSFRQKLRYEWKPKICTKCRLFFHSTSSCPEGVGDRVSESNAHVGQQAPTAILNHEVVEKNRWTVVKRRNRGKMTISDEGPSHRIPPIRPLDAQPGNPPVERGIPNQSKSRRNKQGTVLPPLISSSPECSTQGASDENQGDNGSLAAGNLAITITPIEYFVNGGVAVEILEMSIADDAVQTNLLGDKVEGATNVSPTFLQPFDAADEVDGAVVGDDATYLAPDDIVEASEIGSTTIVAGILGPLCSTAARAFLETHHDLDGRSDSSMEGLDAPQNSDIGFEIAVKHADSVEGRGSRSVGETSGDCPNLYNLDRLTNQSTNLPFNTLFNPLLDPSFNPLSNPYPNLSSSTPFSPSSQTQNQSMPLPLPIIAQNRTEPASLPTLPISNPRQANPTLVTTFDGSSADGDRPFPPGFTPDKSGELVKEGEILEMSQPNSNRSERPSIDANYLTYKDVRRSPRLRKKPARLTDSASTSGLKKGFFK